MKNTKFIVLGIILAAASTLSVAQSIRPPAVSNPGAIVKFGYCATAGDVDCETANRVRNDTDTPYTNGVSGIAAVFNLGSGSKDLTVNFSGSQRTVKYDLRALSAIGNPQPTWTSIPQNVQPFINVLGAYNAKLQCGTATTCDINYVTAMNAGAFNIGGIDYRLQWNPGSTQPFINTAETTSAVNVNYRKDATGEVFTITPLPNPNTSRAIAGLQGEKRRSITSAGQYVMAFTMTVRIQ